MYSYRARWYSPEAGEFLERDPLGPVDSVNLYQYVGCDPVNRSDPTGKETWAVYLDDKMTLTLVNVQNRRSGAVPADLPRLYPWGYPRDDQTRVYVRYSTYSGQIVGAAVDVVQVVRDYRYREANPPWIAHAKETNILEWRPAVEPSEAYQLMDEGGKLANELISGWLLKNAKKRRKFRDKGPIAGPGDFLLGMAGLFSNAASLIGLGTEVSPIVVWAGRALGWGSKAVRYLRPQDFVVQVESMGMPVNLGVLPRDMPNVRDASQWNSGIAVPDLIASH